MSLTTADLDKIKDVIYEPLHQEMRQGFADINRELGHLNRRVDTIEKKVDKFDGRITASENDIKEIYGLLPARPQ